MGKLENKYAVAIWKPKVKIPLGRRKRRWEDNIKITLKEQIMRVWTGLILLMIWTSGGLL
jgi:hypothetical protein